MGSLCPPNNHVFTRIKGCWLTDKKEHRMPWGDDIVVAFSVYGTRNDDGWVHYPIPYSDYAIDELFVLEEWSREIASYSEEEMAFTKTGGFPEDGE